jgi:hypothetical protein
MIAAAIATMATVEEATITPPLFRWPARESLDGRRTLRVRGRRKAGCARYLTMLARLALGAQSGAATDRAARRVVTAPRKRGYWGR